MKKIITILCATLLVLGLFVACQQSGDSLQGVGEVFVKQGTRSLSASIELPGAGDLYWTYTATKADTKYGFIGETEGETPMNVSGTDIVKGLPESLGRFSYGMWDFEFKAYNCVTAPTAVGSLTDLTPVYEGTTSNFEVKAKQNALSMSVDFNGDPDGTGIVVLDGANFDLTIPASRLDSYFGGSDTKTFNDVTITVLADGVQVWATEQALTKVVSKSDLTITMSFTAEDEISFEMEAGQADLTFILSFDGYERSYEDVPVMVFNGLTTTVTGEFDEAEGVVDLPTEVKVPTLEFKAFTVEDDVPTTVESKNSFSEETNAKTVVEFAVGSLNGGIDAKLQMKFIPESNASAFTIINETAEKQVAIAGIDFTLTDKAGNKLDFNELEGELKPVTVTTYIAKNLTETDLRVVYDNPNGADEIIEPKSYDPATGELVFEVSHFSTYYFVSKAEARNLETGRVYNSLVAAIAEANGQTVQLLADVTTTGKVYIQYGQSVTLDLNGYTVRYEGAAGSNKAGVFVVLNGAEFTIDDTSANKELSEVGTGKIVSGTAYAGVALTAANMGKPSEVAKLTVNGGTIEGLYYAIVGNGQRHNTEIVINDGTMIKGTGAGIYHPQKGTLTINGGTIEGDSGIYMKSGNANVTVNAGEIIGKGAYNDYVTTGDGFQSTGDAIIFDNCDYPGGAPNASIGGGTFISTNGDAVASYAKTGFEPITKFITGGTFNKQPAQELLADGYVAIKEGNNWKVTYDPVATIGNKGYSTLADAFAAADNQTIKLLADVTTTDNIYVRKQVTLDLNGKTVKFGGEAENARGVFVVISGADFTVDDTSAEETGTIDADGKVLAGILMTYKNEHDDTKVTKLTVNGGTIKGLGYAVSGNGTRHNTEIVINGGHLLGTVVNDNAGIYHPQRGTLTINGGVIEGATGIYAKSGSVDVTINAGEIKATGVAKPYATTGDGFVSTGDAIVFDNCDYPGGEPQAAIAGGTFTSANGAAVASYAKTGKEPIGKFITGGTFSSEPAQELIADNYAAKQYGAVWKVEFDPVAKIGNKGYSTLEAAIADADGKTVVLQKDVDANIVVAAGKTVVLDLNGHVINGKTVDQKAAITNNGTLTITGNGTVKRADTGSNGYYVVLNYGNLTIENGTFTNNSGDTSTHAGASLIYNCGKASELTINGGSISQGSFNAIKNEGKCTINGGTVSTSDKKYAILSYGTVDIKGGSVTGPIAIRGYKDDKDGDCISTATVSGGTISSGITVEQYYHVTNDYHSSKPSSLTVTGGVFNDCTVKIGEGDGTTFVEDATCGKVIFNVEGYYLNVEKEGLSFTIVPKN